MKNSKRVVMALVSVVAGLIAWVALGSGPVSGTDNDTVHHPDCDGTLVVDLDIGDVTPAAGEVFIKAGPEHDSIGWQPTGYEIPAIAPNGKDVSHADVCVPEEPTETTEEEPSDTTQPEGTTTTVTLPATTTTDPTTSTTIGSPSTTVVTPTTLRPPATTAPPLVTIPRTPITAPPLEVPERPSTPPSQAVTTTTTTTVPVVGQLPATR